MEKKHGGKREGSGRNGKADEQKLVEKLSPMESTALNELEKAVKAGEKWAIELFFKYMYGLPKQVVDMNTSISGSIPIANWVKDQLNDRQDKS
jgi:hypothetical protein